MLTPKISSIPEKEKGILARFIAWFSNWSVRWIPDSMVFVFVLTIIAYLMALSLTQHGPIQLVDDWVKGFWTLLTFAMQMCMLMITGFAVADSKPIKNVIRRLVDIPKTRYLADVPLRVLDRLVGSLGHRPYAVHRYGP